MAYVCKVCGYVYEGDAAPAECPVCHVGADMFEEVKGEMKLAAEHEYGIYAKTVKNNPDITDEDKKYIFDRFFSGDKSHTNKANFGLGLSIAQELTEMLNGDIQVSDTAGGGATFTVSFPLK